MSWTQDKEEKLKELWKKGHTASQIAEILGDTTRNAVIGKAHRLKLQQERPLKNHNHKKNKSWITVLKAKNTLEEKADLNHFF